MELCFVENDKIDAASRKLIRSHVMRGKNVGKKRNGAQRVSNGETPGSSVSPRRRSAVMDIDRPLGDELAYFAFPCQTQYHTRALLYRFMSVQLRDIYPEEFCLSLDNMRDVWFSYIQASETFFHCSLVMANLAMLSMLGQSLQSPIIFRHLQDTYRCVTRDLRDIRTPSDPTVAVVVSLAVHANLTESFGASRVHLEALQRILELRGGIEEYSINWVLWHKICRADLGRALRQGCPTLFYQDALPARAIKALNELSSGPESPKTSFSRYDISASLASTFDELTRFCRALNRDPLHFSMRPDSFQGILILLCYKTIQIRNPADSVANSAMARALHISLLGCVVTLLFDYGRSPGRAQVRLAAQLRDCISELTAELQLKDQPAFLWILFTGAMAYFEPDDATWLKPFIRSCLSTLEVDSWIDAKAVLHQMPWINVYHDKLAFKVWQATMET